MDFATDFQRDRENAVKPFVIVKAHRSFYSGWMPCVHQKSCKTRREAEKEARVLMDQGCPYCRIEKWPNADGGEVVLCEFGVNPGIDAGVQRVMWG